MKGMILAAGLGTRLRPITNQRPKPCVPILNIPLGLWPLEHLIQAGVTDLVVNTHHLPQQVVALFETQRERLKSLVFSPELPTILGSGGGIAKARHYLKSDDSFWVANGDEVFIPSQEGIFQAAWKQHHKTKPLATLLVMKHADVGKKFGGVWVDGNGQVQYFGKENPLPGVLQGLHYTGFQILSPRAFDYLPNDNRESNIFYDIYVKAIAAGERVQVCTVWGDWFETGSPADLLQATEELLTVAQHSPWLQKFLTARGAGTLNGQQLLHAKANLPSTVSTEGFLVMGAGSQVLAPSNESVSLRNVIVLPETVVRRSAEKEIL